MNQPSPESRQGPNSEVFDLFGAVGDETATTEEIRRLEGIFRQDNQTVGVFVRFMLLHAMLERNFEIVRPRDIAPFSCTVPAKPADQAAPFSTGAVLGGNVGYFSSGWPVAYLIATVIVGVGLTIAALVHVSRPSQVVTPSSPLPPSLSPLTSVVARITGMVDCQWADETMSVVNGDHVPLNRKYTLSSGLLEITYDTGAKVILQGPVVYAVESANGGFLSVGKLTGKVTTKAARGLTIRTPTAIVTDLGTEFGVEVSKEGNTVSHVFRGAVRLQAVSTNGKANGNAQVLHENESARVEKSGKQGDSNRVTVLRSSVKSADFIRQIPEQTIKILDLVDVVAGGDGFSGRRDRGINPSNGRVTNTEVLNNPTFGDGKYHLVDELPFVDGVFIPHTNGEAVQLDSVGHAFGDFPSTDNKTCGSLWAGQAGNDSAELDGINYASPGHGNLAMDANKGITFDLDAIRRANPNYKLVRFRAVAGNAEQISKKGYAVYADVWVFIDGQMRFRRREITRYNGAFAIMIPINNDDRRLEFLPTEGIADTTPPREAAEH
jgi:hypothetical protein